MEGERKANRRRGHGKAYPAGRGRVRGPQMQRFSANDSNEIPMKKGHWNRLKVLVLLHFFL